MRYEGYKEGPTVILIIKENEVSLQILEKGLEKNGWKLTPLQHPLTVRHCC